MRIQHCINVVSFSVLNIKQGQKAAQAELIAADRQMGCVKGGKWERMRVNLFQKVSYFVYECFVWQSQPRAGLGSPPFTPQRQYLGPWGNAWEGSRWESRVAWLRAGVTAARILLLCLDPALGLTQCPGSPVSARGGQGTIFLSPLRHPMLSLAEP